MSTKRAKAVTEGSISLADRLDFETTVAENGYVWWYVDGMSDDGDHGLTIIAFIGSVFSPYYASARRKGLGDPENFVALNVALYGKSAKRWAMTERARGALARTCLSFRVGPSEMVVDGDELVIRIDETCVPFPRPLRGEVRVKPTALASRTYQLDAEGRHHWSPIAPACRLEVSMEAPSLAWEGEGYLDRNQGTRPLEDDFSYWDWSRAAVGEDTAILYDVTRRDGSRLSIGTKVDRSGRSEDFPPPPNESLPPNRWRVPRGTQADGQARIVETLEDTPFYSRSVIETRLLDQTTRAMHESLSLDRFERRWVQLLLPFRMPRRG